MYRHGISIWILHLYGVWRSQACRVKMTILIGFLFLLRYPERTNARRLLHKYLDSLDILVKNYQIAGNLYAAQNSFVMDVLDTGLALT